MILPTKHIPIRSSLLGQASLLLPRLKRPKTMSRLWEDLRSEVDLWSYERFLLALDLLYIVGLVDIRDGQLVRMAK